MFIPGGLLRRLVLLALSLTTAAAPAAAAVDRATARPRPERPVAACTMSALPVPFGAYLSQVNGGDRTGRYLVGETIVAGRGPVLLLWHRATLREFDTAPLAPYAWVTPTDVNRHGVVVGNRIQDPSTFRSQGWVYRAGRFTLLPGLTPREESTAAAINSRGDIVGTSMDTSAFPVIQRVVLWRADRPGTVQELRLLGSTQRSAMGVDIDDDGTVLGFVGGRPSEGQHPYVWPARGRPYALAAPAGTGYPYAVAIRNGWVAGAATPLNGNSAVARWDLRTGTGRLVSTSSGTALAVNRRGTVAAVGALIHRDGRISDLGETARPTVLSDDGSAAGSATSSGPAVRWTGC